MSRCFCRSLYATSVVVKAVRNTSRRWRVMWCKRHDQYRLMEIRRKRLHL